eukprot:13466-Heterococcus_DN1.PRE.1
MRAPRTALFASCNAQIWRASGSRSILASSSVNLRMQSNHATSRANQTTRDKAARIPRHLTLVFDINKTIVMADAAGNKTESDVYNGILAEITWGSVTQQHGKSEWVWAGKAPNTAQPKDSSAGLMTYSDYVHEVLHCDEPADSLAINKAKKEARDQLKGSFTDTNAPGQQLRSYYDSLQAAVRLPDAVRSHPFAKHCGLHDRSNYFLISAYFEAIHALTQHNVRFSIQFRTFGSDLPEVLLEHNAYCNGKHPLYKKGQRSLNGTTATALAASAYNYDLRIKLGDADTCGAMYRDDQGIALVCGTHTTPLNRAELSSSTTAITDHKQIVQYMQGTRRSALAIRDHYEYWRANMESAITSKVVYIDIDDPHELVLVFDDNVQRSCAHIIDARCAHTGVALPYRDTQDKHLIRAEPYLALAQNCSGSSNYFIQEICKRWEGGTDLMKKLQQDELAHTKSKL